MSNKKRKNASRKSSGLTWFLLAVVVILVALLTWMIVNIDTGSPEIPDHNPSAAPAVGLEADTETPSGQLTQTDTNSGNAVIDTIELSNGLVITDIDSYTGAFVEDGSNETVSDILMITVENIGDEYIRYAEINLLGRGGEAHFSLSTLGPGEVVVLLEQNRTAYSEGYTSASARKVEVFSEEPDTLADKLEIQLLDGGLNITNISGEDIDGEIIVYFKSFYKDVYYGGITYRGRITGGLNAGEIRQVMSGNISADGTKVVFVTISE